MSTYYEVLISFYISSRNSFTNSTRAKIDTDNPSEDIRGCSVLSAFQQQTRKTGISSGFETKC
jgi:hypothetical protein